MFTYLLQANIISPDTTHFSYQGRCPCDVCVYCKRLSIKTLTNYDKKCRHRLLSSPSSSPNTDGYSPIWHPRRESAIHIVDKSPGTFSTLSYFPSLLRVIMKTRISSRKYLHKCLVKWTYVCVPLLHHYWLHHPGGFRACGLEKYWSQARNMSDVYYLDNPDNLRFNSGGYLATVGNGVCVCVVSSSMHGDSPSSSSLSYFNNNNTHFLCVQYVFV